MRWFNRMFSLKFPNLNKKDVGDTSVDYIKDNILKDLKGTY